MMCSRVARLSLPRHACIACSRRAGGAPGNSPSGAKQHVLLVFPACAQVFRLGQELRAIVQLASAVSSADLMDAAQGYRSRGRSTGGMGCQRLASGTPTWPLPLTMWTVWKSLVVHVLPVFRHGRVRPWSIGARVSRHSRFTLWRVCPVSRGYMPPSMHLTRRVRRNVLWRSPSFLLVGLGRRFASGAAHESTPPPQWWQSVRPFGVGSSTSRHAMWVMVWL